MTNQDWERFADTTDEWIRDRPGILERRQAAVGAVTRALARSPPEELDAVLVGTISPDMPMPSCAAFLQHKLGAKRAFAFDLSAACAGSLFAMSIADQYIRTGSAKRVLVVGAELLTRIIDWK